MTLKIVRIIFGAFGPRVVITVTALSVALAVTAVPLLSRPRASEPAKQEPGNTAEGAFRPTDLQWKGLQIAPVALRVFRSEQLTEGNIAVDDDLNTPVYSPFSGRVVKLVAKLGDHVEQGAPLFAIEAIEFVQSANTLITAVAAEKTTRTQVRQAEINERRAHELYQANGGSLKDWQQSQTDLAAAQNTLRSAEIGLASARNQLRIVNKTDQEIAALEAQPTQKLDPLVYIPAPISGTVTQRQVGIGQYIQSVASGAANPVYTIGDLSKVWLIANIREADAAQMQSGISVEVRVPAYPDRVFRARITWVAPAVDASTHRLAVRAEVDNPENALKPMMFASFTIVIGAEIEAAAVPQKAIVYEGTSARVWVAHDDRSIESRLIQVGRVANGLAEILRGVRPGEKVVSAGALFIDRAASDD